METLLEAMFIYDGAREIWDALCLLFCLLVDFMWSGTIVDGMFVVYLDLGDVVFLHANYVFKGLWRMKMGF
jgi:hypothetical protein